MAEHSHFDCCDCLYFLFHLEGAAFYRYHASMGTVDFPTLLQDDSVPVCKGNLGSFLHCSHGVDICNVCTFQAKRDRTKELSGAAWTGLCFGLAIGALLATIFFPQVYVFDKTVLAPASSTHDSSKLSVPFS